MARKGVLIDFRGEKICRQELVRRLVTLHPDEGRAAILKRYYEAGGPKVDPTIFAAARRSLGLPTMGRRHKRSANGQVAALAPEIAVAALAPEIASAAAQAAETREKKIVLAVKHLLDAVNLTGKDFCRRTLEVL